MIIDGADFDPKKWMNDMFKDSREVEVSFIRVKRDGFLFSFASRMFYLIIPKWASLQIEETPIAF